MKLSFFFAFHFIRSCCIGAASWSKSQAPDRPSWIMSDTFGEPPELSAPATTEWGKHDRTPSDRTFFSREMFLYALTRRSPDSFASLFCGIATLIQHSNVCIFTGPFFRAMFFSCVVLPLASWTKPIYLAKPTKVSCVPNNIKRLLSVVYFFVVYPIFYKWKLKVLKAVLKAMFPAFQISWKW